MVSSSSRLDTYCVEMSIEYLLRHERETNILQLVRTGELS